MIKSCCGENKAMDFDKITLVPERWEKERTQKFQE